MEMHKYVVSIYNEAGNFIEKVDGELGWVCEKCRHINFIPVDNSITLIDRKNNYQWSKHVTCDKCKDKSLFVYGRVFSAEHGPNIIKAIEVLTRKGYKVYYSGEGCANAYHHDGKVSDIDPYVILDYDGAMHFKGAMPEGWVLHHDPQKSLVSVLAHEDTDFSDPSWKEKAMGSLYEWAKALPDISPSIETINVDPDQYY
jgi:hypothetical protein